MSSRADAGLRIHLVAIERPAAAILDRIVGKGVVPLDGRQDARIGQAEFFGLAAAQHQKGIGAGARHDAVIKPQRIGDEARGQILVERQRLFHQCERKRQRVGALRDAEFAEILARRAVGPHVIGGEKSEARIRPRRSRTDRPHRARTG